MPSSSPAPADPGASRPCPVREKVVRAARRRCRVHLLWELLLALLGVALLGAAIGPRLREGQCACLLLAGGLAALLLLSLRCLHRALRRRSLRQLCREYQRDFPEDANRLETTLELEEKQARGKPLTAFQQEYLASLQRRYLGKEGRLSLARVPSWQPPWRPRRMLLALLALPLLLWMGRNAWRRLFLHWTAPPPVQVVLSPGGEVPLHQDIRVTGELLRHHAPDGMWLELDWGGEVRRESMNPAGKNRWELTLYDLTRCGRLRAVTRTGASPWTPVVAYPPPAPLSVEMVSTPPAYTGLPSRTFHDFTDLSLVEGERLSVTCLMPQGEAWRLLGKSPGEAGKETEIPQEAFLPADGDSLQAEFQRGRYRARGKAFRVQVTPDYPPAVEARTPREDGEFAPTEHPAWSALLSDDYGLTAVSLHYSVDDQPQQCLSLWEEGGAPRELSLHRTPDLGPLEAGQVVVAWLEARDNRDPNPQTTRGNIVILTVKEPPSPLSPDNQSAGEGKRQEMSLEDLVSETKRLLRDTLGVARQEGVSSPEAAQHRALELSRDLRNLSQALRGREAQIAQASGMDSLPPAIATPLAQAAQAVGKAAEQVENGQAAQAQLPLRRALSQLTRLEAMLARNAQALSASGGGQGGSQDGGQNASSGQETAGDSQRGDRRQPLEELRRALDELQEIRGSLQDLLPRLSPEDGKALQNLADRTETLVPRIAAQESGAPAAGPLRNGARELEAARQALEADSSLPQAKARGQRALLSLAAAEEALSQGLRSEARMQMDRLSRQAEELARRQEALARENAARSPAPGGGTAERKAAREKQAALGKDTQAFQAEAREVSQELARRFPHAAETLENASTRTPWSQEVETAQSRAANSLLYGRYSRAADSQARAAQGLRQWGRQLGKAAEEIPLYGARELQEALEELERHREALANAQGEGKAEAAQGAARALEGMGRAFGQPSLERLAQSLEEAAPQAQLTALEQASRILRQELLKFQGQEERRLMLNSAPPPRKFRLQTQEYFRQLTNQEPAP